MAGGDEFSPAVLDAEHLQLAHGQGASGLQDGSDRHPRQARTTDEGGRGLFLVAQLAQLAQRWGTRYVRDGKTI
ncbi:hypothetical protein ADL29_07595 [Streptomyces chattanoogensis]|uniref:Histidine kinase/HSP90-like ATPase domain-containing protein n=1 Tax=Streptomyces chattanoogensis TaxID=66876 RepID=A0A0N0H2A3_9ACTN|nr:hypothetical protein ADL29_07595 [Streptomyces chattanoogensis]